MSDSAILGGSRAKCLLIASRFYVIYPTARLLALVSLSGNGLQSAQLQQGKVKFAEVRIVTGVSSGRIE